MYIVNAYGHGYFIDVDSKQKKQATVASDVLRLSKYGFYYDKINDRPLMISGNEVHEILFTNGTISTRLIAVLPEMPGSISAIIFDKSGRYLFVATTTNGLFIYRLSSFKIYKSAGDATENNNYGCVLVDSNHILTNRSILFNLTTGDSKKIPVNIGTSGMAIDSAGYIWHGGYVSSFSSKTWNDIVLAPSTGTDILLTSYLSKKPEGFG